MIDWIDILGPLAGILGTIATIYLRIRGTSVPSLKTPRARLRDDLEMLKMLNDAGHSFGQDVVTERINTLINKVYAQPYEREETALERFLKRWVPERLKKLKPRQPFLFIMGVIAAVGFSFWSWYLVRDEFTWWIVGTVFGALAGFGWISISYEQRAQTNQQNRPEQKNPPTSES